MDEYYLLLCFLGTQDALIEHTNRALYQPSIWATCLKKHQNIPPPEGFGWIQEEGWKPVWALLPELRLLAKSLLSVAAKHFPYVQRSASVEILDFSVLHFAIVVAHVIVFIYCIGMVLRRPLVVRDSDVKHTQHAPDSILFYFILFIYFFNFFIIIIFFKAYEPKFPMVLVMSLSNKTEDMASKQHLMNINELTNKILPK